MPRLVKRYFCLLWTHRSLATIGLLLATITAIAGISLLAVSGWFISATALAGLSIASAHGFNYFAPGAIVRGLSITRTVGRYGERISTHEATLRVISRLRAELFGELARHPWQEKPLNNHAASSRLMEDIKHAEALYLSALVPGFVMLLCSLLYLITASLFLPGAALWLTPILIVSIILLPWVFMHRVLKPQDTLHQQRNQQWNSASSLFNNVRTLVLYQQLENSSEQLLQVASLADSTERHASQARQKVLIVSQLTFAIQTLVILWLGLSSLSDGQIEGSHLFMLLLLTLGVQEVIFTGTSALANFKLGYAALERIDHQASTHFIKRNRIIVPAESISIQLADVQYRYPQRESAVISQLNNEFIAPHWYWITARSGQGKTTLLHLLSGHLTPSQGTITISGANAEQLSLMPQSIDLLRGTLRYNLCLHQNHTDEALINALTIVELEHWVQHLPEGLDTWLGHGERQLSGGELKRLGLARLVLQNSRILLLDEPTAGIDQPRAKRILDKLHLLWKDKLVIINSHDSSLMTGSDQHVNL